jgi:tetratricopeptide (TPR) repeat protein
MSSIIEGYNYDIFISYRQKDNKGDRWVSEFVEALKTELESTFKEEISVYFDINPHDGLLETHDVDASLKDKLKCLVFIPIISRTYCDPKSFAWEHEFKAFVELALKDHFGLKIKLPNGNVASRVLPIRIHDLDAADIKECESVLGGVLRGIEFVYAEPGVNRPLKPKDSEEKNTNKTNYRNQINKVGNAIKEIISGLLAEPIELAKEKPLHREPSEEVHKEQTKKTQEKPFRSAISKLFSVILILTLLVIAAVLAYPKIFKRDKLASLRSADGKISVAVIPFQNMTNDTIWNVWQNGIQDILITSLSNSEELTVRQAESINSLIQSKGLPDYASITTSVAKNVSQKLDANIFIYGNIKQAGSTLRVYTQLIDSKTDQIFKSFQIESPAKEEIIFQIVDSLSVMVKNFLELSKLIKEDTPYDQKNVAAITSPQAYKYIMDGEKAFGKQNYQGAINMYLQALAIDSSSAYPFLSITWAYLNQDSYENARKWYLKAYEKRNLMSRAQKIDADVLHACLFGTLYEIIGHLKEQLEFDDQNPMAYHDLGAAYMNLFQYDKAIPEYKKSLEIYNKWGVKPYSIYNYTSLGYAYHKTGQYKKEDKLYRKAEKYFPDDPDLICSQTILSLTLADTVAANRYIEKLRPIMKQWQPEAAITRTLAWIYSEAGMLDKAEEYYRQALSLEPGNPLIIKNLAYFLIDNDRNINEGLELVERTLKSQPDNYSYLDCKGWGLYKQGKYQEALEILQKSWDLRRQNAVYNHEAFLHLEAAKKAVAEQKNI